MAPRCQARFDTSSFGGCAKAPVGGLPRQHNTAKPAAETFNLARASADEIYNRPVDLFVAHFTGASNLLAGRVLERNGDFGLIETGPSHRLAAWLPPGVAAGSAVTIAVRPENVRCGADGAGDAGPNRFTARVLASRYGGVQTVYELDVLGGRLEAVEMGTSMRHPVNSTLEITLPVAQCWAYPAEDAADLG
jgi:iron(III) transport system ATP-binding protein